MMVKLDILRASLSNVMTQVIVKSQLSAHLKIQMHVFAVNLLRNITHVMMELTALKTASVPHITPITVNAVKILNIVKTTKLEPHVFLTPIA